MSLKAHVAYTTPEWRRVRLLYQSEKVEELKEALEILNMWNARMGERSAMFIPCTEMVLRCTLESKKLTATPDLRQHENLKMLLGCCVIRFVNFANEITQANYKSYIKMATAVREVGIPEWLVIVRHEVSHSVTFPSLHRLQKCHEFAKQWLWNRVWRNPEQAALADVGEWELRCAQQAKLDLITSSIVNFINWRMKDTNNNANKVYTFEEVNNLPHLQNIRGFIETDIADFLDILLSDGCLILSEKEYINGQFKDTNDLSNVIRLTLQIFWSPIVSLLMHHNLISTFLLKMLDKLKEPALPELARSQLVTWSKLVIDGLRDSSGHFTSGDWQQILLAITSLKSLFEETLIKTVMSMVPELKRKQRQQLMELMKMTQCSNSDTSLEKSAVVAEKIHTVDELFVLLKEANQQEVDMQNLNEPSSGHWKKCNPEEWFGVPLGLTPNQTVESLNLILDHEYVNRIRERDSRKNT